MNSPCARCAHPRYEHAGYKSGCYHEDEGQDMAEDVWCTCNAFQEQGPL